MVLDGHAVEWSDRLKYLGIYLASSRFVKFDIALIQSKEPFMLPVTQYFHTATELMNLPY